MEVRHVSAKEYDGLLQKPCAVYLTGRFNELRGDTSQSRRYLLFGDGRVRVGLACAIRDGCLVSPSSAPFGGFARITAHIGIGEYDRAVTALIEYARDKGCSRVSLTLAPPFYDPEHIAKTVTALANHGFQLHRTELNYHLDVQRLRQGYAKRILHSGRKNLKRALESDLTFRAGAERDSAIAYEILRRNRESKGYPLAMSRDQIEKTKTVVSGDEFLVCRGNEPVAAALVFAVTDRIAQVIYWGHLPGTEAVRPVNFLAWKLLEHYGSLRFDYLDIGPGSGGDGLPNYGLCDFKESIGCSVTLKHTLSRMLP